MPAIITSGSMPLQISREIQEIYRVAMAEAATEYDKLLKVETAPSGPTYYSAQITGIGLPSAIGEGDGVPYDVPVEGNPMMRNYREAGLGYIITKLMIDDELFGKMKQLPADLARSMKLLMDIEAATFFDNLDGTEVSRDGSSVCGAHTLLNDIMGNGDQTNKAGTGADLSESTFKTAVEYFDNVVDELGAPLILTPESLLISSSDQYIAHRLMTEMYGSSVDSAGLAFWGSSAPTSGNKADVNKNFANPENGFVAKWSAMPSRFLSSSNWFLRAKEHDMKWYWKSQPNQTSEVEFDTDNTKYKSKMRYGIWADEYRGIFGNFQ